MTAPDSTHRASMRFRITLSVVCLGVWIATIWLASHSSDTPVVFNRYSFFWFVLLALVFVIALILTVSVLRNQDDLIWKNRYSVLLLLFSIGFSVLLAEFFVRQFDPLGISYYAEAKRYHLDKIADSDLFFRHRPGIDEVYQGVRVTTNKLGLRDREIDGREDGEYRVLFLGDSVTFGWGVPIEDTFVRQTESLLRERIDRPVRTINSGVGGYNSRSEYKFLQRHGTELHPDAVVLLYIGNDIEGTPELPFDPWSTNSFEGKSPPEKIRMVLGKSWLFRLITHISTFRVGDPAARIVDAASPGWRESVAALTAITRFCKDRQIPFVVLLYRIQSAEPENSISINLKELAAREGFLFADLISVFDGQEPRQLINSIVDSHPNSYGHAFIANAVVEMLQQNQLLPLSSTPGGSAEPMIPVRAVTGQ